jgi:hypothetical protein
MNNNNELLAGRHWFGAFTGQCVHKPKINQNSMSIQNSNPIPIARTPV